MYYLPDRVPNELGVRWINRVRIRRLQLKQEDYNLRQLERRVQGALQLALMYDRRAQDTREFKLYPGTAKAKAAGVRLFERLSKRYYDKYIALRAKCEEREQRLYDKFLALYEKLYPNTRGD